MAAQSFKVVAARGVDMVTYETFMVRRGEFMTLKEERRMTEDALYERMKAAISAEMEARGYRYVEDSTAAQLWVSYVAGAFRVMDSGNVGPLGRTPVSDPAEIDQSGAWSRDSREGLLEIDVVDGRSKKELWKSSGSLTVDSADTKMLDAAVYKAMKKFPNRKKARKR